MQAAPSIVDQGQVPLGLSGVLRRFKRGESVTETGVTLGMVKNVYDSAIEYTGISPGMRGMLMLSGLFTASIAFWGGQFFLFDILKRGKIGIFEASIIFFSGLFFLFGIYFAIKSIRLELFRPEDEPTIFDRKNRKVYRIYRETYAGWGGLVSAWPMKTAEYDWDLIDAEHHAAVTTTGATISRQHGLIFLVRKSATDSTLVDSFAIGNSMQMGEVTVPAVWEHIRRFMEEGGPHLPPGDVLRPIDRPYTFWQCMAATGPYGAKFRIWWREQTALMVLGLIFFPIILPTMSLLGVFTWLSYRTSIPIKWSPEVQVAIQSPQ
ncbi:hypothetical protein LJR289_004696 [Pseudoduganella sp. LjRoot289]|uniref:DUF6708 domain-containing protein n=1 Tax=Pseudoduganella sp. LjRoot289 TaxID=3342314 RepID=UPI003ECC95AC